MKAACPGPLSWETLVDYWAGDLPAQEVERIDAHVMGCATCAATSARVGSVTESVRGAIPTVLSEQALARLQARGLRMLTNPMAPGDRREVVFPAGADLLIHELGGLDLASAERVTVTVSVDSTGQPLDEILEAPFDRARGLVRIACQQHFSSLPPDVAFEVRARKPGGVEAVTRYVVLHVYEAAAGGR